MNITYKPLYVDGIKRKILNGTKHYLSQPCSIVDKGSLNNNGLGFLKLYFTYFFCYIVFLKFNVTIYTFNIVPKCTYDTYCHKSYYIELS